MQNYYEILEVSQNASQQIIDKAYRVLAMKYHPDVQPRDKVFWAEAQLKQINEAYEVLSDPQKREAYNLEIGLSSRVQDSQEYQDLHSENEELHQKLDDLASEKESAKKSIFRDKPRSNSSFSPVNVVRQLNIKEGIRNIGQLAYNETKKPKEERSKDIKALILTVIIMAILIFLFLKVPFLRNLLSL